MLRADQEGDAQAARKHAEAVLNLIAGGASPDQRDWNGDGSIEDLGDDFGLMAGGEERGYFWAVSTTSAEIANAAGSTTYMEENSGRVAACTEYLEDQLLRLREHLITIATSPAGTDTAPEVRSAVSLADQILNGFDADEDGMVEPLAGECGALTTLEYAYSMADMPLFPMLGTQSNSSGGTDGTAIGTTSPTATIASTPNVLSTPTGALQPTVPGLPTLPDILPTDGILPDLLPTDDILPDLLPSENPWPPILQTPILNLP